MRGSALQAGLAAAFFVLGIVRQGEAGEPLPTPLDHLGTSAARAFGPPGLYAHGAAVAVTAAMAYGGLDHRARVEIQRGVEGSPGAAALARGAVVGGYVLPAVAPLFFLAGFGAGHRGAARVGAAATQALALTLGATFALKALTGRPFPLNGGDPRAPDRLDHPEYARAFGPPSLRRVAWPSGHTAVGFSLASSLTGALPGRWWVPLAGYTVAAALGAGMLVGDHHWASDVVAGALLGQATGAAVGRSFAPGSDLNAPSVTLLSLPEPGGLRVALVGAW